MLRKNIQLLVFLSIFIGSLWTNGHQKGASLPLLGAGCTSGMLNGYAPEYVSFNTSTAEIVINRVIDYVNDSEKYKEYIEMRADIMMMRG